MKKKLLLFLCFCYSSITFGGEISLNQFLEKVKDQNLNLKLEHAKQSASEEKAVGIRLPPPMISLLQGKNTPGDSSTGYQINQEVPFPTKLSANHSSRIYESRAQKETLLANKYEIFAKAKLAYIDLWLMQERIGVINQKREILVDHIKLARSAVRSDSFIKIHLLKAESDLDLLENELDSAKQKFKEKQLALSEIVNEDQQTFNPIPIAPPISSIPKLDEQGHIPKLESLRLSLEGMKERESEVRASWLPDFNLQYKHMNASSMSSAYGEVMVGITLPFVYFWQPNADTLTANSDRLQAELSLNSEKRSIDTQLAALYSKVESLQKQLLNIKNKLIPRALERMKIVHNLAPRDIEIIQNHRETMEVLPELKMIEIDLRSQYEESIAEIEKFITNKGQSRE